jgi:DNA-binding response OmpR family regulator
VCAREPAPVPRAVARMTSTAAGPRVLVVEDDPSVRGLLRTLLAAEGYDVVAAADGLAGLVQAAQQKPALVLLDVVMPDLGGMRMLEEMRAEPTLADVPVVVVTGKTEIVPGLRDLLGEDAVIAKPFAVERLLATVADITGGPRDDTGPAVTLPD